MNDRSFVTSEFSPDGRWLAYGSNELNGRTFQVFVQPYPPTGAKYQVNPQTGSAPIWSRDGKRLFLGSASRAFAADVQTVPAFRAGQLVEFDMAGMYASQAALRNFDLMPDGKRFLVSLPPGSKDDPARRAAPQINLVLNWTEELKRLVPTR